MLNAGVRPRNTPAHCRPHTAGRPSSWSAMSAIASRSMRIFPARARTTRSFPTARPFASISKTCASRRSASGLRESGTIRNRSIRAQVGEGDTRHRQAARRGLEGAGGSNHPPEEVAMFLMRCLFTMFAEDVGLLPEKSFREVLEGCEQDPPSFSTMSASSGRRWTKAPSPTCQEQSKEVQRRVPQTRTALPLGREEIGELRHAANITGRRSIPRSSARCWSRRSIRSERRGSARTTRRAPMLNGWSSRPSSSHCARTGAE